MTHGIPAQSPATDPAETVADDGWTVAGVLDRALTDRLLRAVDEVAAPRDNLGPRVRRALFMAYSYRWLTLRDVRFEDVPAWAGLSPIRRQSLGDATVDPFSWACGEPPLDARATEPRAA